VYALSGHRLYYFILFTIVLTLAPLISVLKDECYVCEPQCQSYFKGYRPLGCWNPSTIMILSILRETHVFLYGYVLFMHLMALSFIKCLLWKEFCICLMNVDLKLQSLMFLVKYFCQINVGIDDYMVEDLCV
jgi:hypothetical protein